MAVMTLFLLVINCSQWCLGGSNAKERSNNDCNGGFVIIESLSAGSWSGNHHLEVNKTTAGQTISGKFDSLQQQHYLLELIPKQEEGDSNICYWMYGASVAAYKVYLYEVDALECIYNIEHHSVSFLSTVPVQYLVP